MAKSYRLIHDENVCIGCQACSVACRSQNHVPEPVYKVQVAITIKPEYSTMEFTRLGCVMCDNAPCVHVCPTRATFQTKDKIVLIDETRCVSCKYCALACPYGARYEDPITHALQKCDFCYYTRLLKGEYPACVEICPTDALIFGDINDPQSEVSQKLKKSAVLLPKAHYGTKPKVMRVPVRQGIAHE